MNTLPPFDKTDKPQFNQQSLFDWSEENIPQFQHVVLDCQCSGKKCTKCTTFQCCGDFSKDKHNKDGYVSQCKKCKDSYRKTYQPSSQALERKRSSQKAYIAAHREERKIYNKTYQEVHHEQIKTYRREYRETHREQIKVRLDAWHQANPDYKKIYNQEYRQKNSDRIRAQRRQAYLDNPEPFKKQATAYAKNNPERVKAQKRAYREANFERYQQRDREYKIRNRHRVRLWLKSIKANRRARQTQAGGSYTVQEWQDLKAKYDYTCLCCRRREPDITLTADHIVPISKQGTSYISNIQPLCGPCNSKKHDKTIDYRMRGIHDKEI